MTTPFESQKLKLRYIFDTAQDQKNSISDQQTIITNIDDNIRRTVAKINVINETLTFESEFTSMGIIDDSSPITLTYGIGFEVEFINIPEIFIPYINQRLILRLGDADLSAEDKFTFFQNATISYNENKLIEVIDTSEDTLKNVRVLHSLAFNLRGEVGSCLASDDESIPPVESVDYQAKIFIEITNPLFFR